MRNLAIVIFIAFIVVTLGLYLVSFQVRETESCLVTTFGRPTGQILGPRRLPYFKWPFPIQQVYKFDSRMRVFAPELEETPTAGGEPIIVNTYVVWRIARPLEFFNAIKTVKKAEDELLRTRIRNTQNNVIGRHYLSEFVNSDPVKIKFDSRMRVFAPELEETPTAGGEPIIVNTYVVWRIARPLEFFNAIKTVKKAEDELLRTRIRNTQNNVIGRHYLSEFVNSDPVKIKFQDIENEMLSDLQRAVDDANYGIEIKALGIKQLKVSEEVSKEVFARMTAERNRLAEAIISQGNAEAIKIKTDAKSKSDELIAAAEARAKAIRGQGDVEAAKHYKKLEANPKLAMFLRDLEAAQKTLESNTTLVVPTDVEPFSLLRGMPDLKQIDPNQP